MKPAVICTVDSTGDAQRIVAQLRHSGFASDRISVLFEREKTAPEAASTLGWIVGVGSIDGFEEGSFFAAGPILTSLSIASRGGAAGGLVDVLRALGVSESEAEHYQADLAVGRVLVAAHTDEPRARALAKQSCEAAGVLKIRLTTWA